MEYLEKHLEKAERQTGVSISYTTAIEHAASAYITGLVFSTEAHNTKQFYKILSWLPWEEETLIRPYYNSLEKIKTRSPEQREMILKGCSYLRTDNAYANLQKALYAEEQNNIKEAEEYFKIFAGNCPSGFLHQAVEFAKRTGCSLTPLIEQCSIEIWDEYAKTLAKHLDIAGMSNFIREVTPSLSGYPVYILRLEQQFLEKQLSNIDMEDAKLAKLLEQYCASVSEEAKYLYKKELLTGANQYILPFKYQFAFGIDKALVGIEPDEPDKTISILRKTAQIYSQGIFSLKYLHDLSENIFEL